MGATLKLRIEIVGALASGKTALARLLSDEPSSERFTIVFEDLEPIRVQRAYWATNRSTSSFFIQSVYYRHRYEQLVTEGDASKNEVLISDFSLSVDHYAYSCVMKQMGLLTALEYEELGHLERLYGSLLPPAKGLIYCYCTPDVLATRISERRRKEESGVNSEFLKLLVEECDGWVKQTSMPVLKIERFGSGPELAKRVHDFIASVTVG